MTQATPQQFEDLGAIKENVRSNEKTIDRIRYENEKATDRINDELKGVQSELKDIRESLQSFQIQFIRGIIVATFGIVIAQVILKYLP